MKMRMHGRQRKEARLRAPEGWVDVRAKGNPDQARHYSGARARRAVRIQRYTKPSRYMYHQQRVASICPTKQATVRLAKLAGGTRLVQPISSKCASKMTANEREREASTKRTVWHQVVQPLTARVMKCINAARCQSTASVRAGGHRVSRCFGQKTGQGGIRDHRGQESLL